MKSSTFKHMLHSCNLNFIITAILTCDVHSYRWYWLLFCTETCWKFMPAITFAFLHQNWIIHNRQHFVLCLWLFYLPSVLWCYAVGWAAGRAPACKILSGGCWYGYLPGARCRFTYGPADATATHHPDWFTFLVLAHLGSTRQRAVEHVAPPNRNQIIQHRLLAGCHLLYDHLAR